MKDINISSIILEAKKIILEDSVIAVNATHQIGEIFDIEKLNYANKKLNELNIYIAENIEKILRTKITELLDSMPREERREPDYEPIDELKGAKIGYNQARREDLKWRDNAKK